MTRGVRLQHHAGPRALVRLALDPSAVGRVVEAEELHEDDERGAEV